MLSNLLIEYLISLEIRTRLIKTAGGRISDLGRLVGEETRLKMMRE